MRIILLCLGLAFAGELEVEGDLKVSGNIDAQNNPITNVGIPQSMSDAINGNVLQDALRESGPFDYKTVILRISTEYVYGNQVPVNYRAYKDLESTNYIGSNFDDYLSSLSSQGYELYKISEPITYSSYYMYLYTFRKLIEE